MNKGMLLGKVAIVTGGNRGIGRAIAELFAQEGCSLALFGTNEGLGIETEIALKKNLSEGQKVLFYKVDVSQHKACGEAIDQVLKEFGTVDILVNNAGITKDQLLMKMSEDDWDQVLNTNLKSVYNTCHAVIRPMMKARKGKIINVTSIVGIMGNPGQTNYAASKGGMISFSKSLSKEVGSRGILVNCIAPGFIETAMTEGIPEEKKKSFMDSISLRRFGTSQEVANVALFLASPLSDYVTGQTIVVDGGLH